MVNKVEWTLGFESLRRIKKRWSHPLTVLSHPFAVESVWRHVTCGLVFVYTDVAAVMECSLDFMS